MGVWAGLGGLVLGGERPIFSHQARDHCGALSRRRHDGCIGPRDRRAHAKDFGAAGGGGQQAWRFSAAGHTVGREGTCRWLHLGHAQQRLGDFAARGQGCRVCAAQRFCARLDVVLAAHGHGDQPCGAGTDRAAVHRLGQSQPRKSRLRHGRASVLWPLGHGALCQARWFADEPHSVQRPGTDRAGGLDR